MATYRKALEAIGNVKIPKVRNNGLSLVELELRMTLSEIAGITREALNPKMATDHYRGDETYQ